MVVHASKQESRHDLLHAALCNGRKENLPHRVVRCVGQKVLGVDVEMHHDSLCTANA